MKLRGCWLHKGGRFDFRMCEVGNEMCVCD